MNQNQPNHLWPSVVSVQRVSKKYYNFDDSRARGITNVADRLFWAARGRGRWEGEIVGWVVGGGGGGGGWWRADLAVTL